MSVFDAAASRALQAVLLTVVGLKFLAPLCAQEEFSYPEIVDRLTDLERLALLPVKGETAGQLSSYDRASRYDEKTKKYLDWDANVDNGQTAGLRREGEYVVLEELKGPGCLWRIWSGNPRSGPFLIFLDDDEPTFDFQFENYFNGTEETWPPLSDKRVPWPPKNSVSVPQFGPESLGVRGWASGTALYHCTSRGWNSYVPIPFQSSCKIVARPWVGPYNHDGWGMFYHFNYMTFPKGTRVPTFRLNLSTEDRRALEAGNEALARVGSDPSTPRPGEETIRRQVAVPPGETKSVVDVDGPRAITALKVSLPLPESPADRELLRQITLQITWDEDKKPAVWSPLGDFFGTAPGHNKYRSLPLGMTDDHFYSYWYMPFATRAHVELTNDSPDTSTVEFMITVAPLTRPISALGRFHAKWHRDAFLSPARPIDWTLLKTQGRGRYCGAMLHIWNPKGDWWGEGDEKFFVDGEKFPSTFGTGTEDYFGYAWADPNLFSNAFHNQTIYGGRDGHTSVNRWHITDNVPFQTSFEAALEKYFPNDRPTLYAAIAYWYLASDGVDSYQALPVEERVDYFTN